MPFAVIQTGGKQHRVEPGQIIEVEKLPYEEGATVELTDVLLVSDDSGLHHGTPLVDGAKVVGRVVKQDARPRKLSSSSTNPRFVIARRRAIGSAITRIAIDDIVTG